MVHDLPHEYFQKYKLLKMRGNHFSPRQIPVEKELGDCCFDVGFVSTMAFD